MAWGLSSENATAFILGQLHVSSEAMMEAYRQASTKERRPSDADSDEADEEQEEL